MSDGRDLDTAIAAYRLRLAAHAELAPGDLDEIEDHLRTLATELRTSGLGAAEAIAEATHRLGEPGVLAREHARVRTAFGPRLSRVRAWAAAGVLLPSYIAFASIAVGALTLGAFGINLVLSGAMLAALIAGVTWARPIMLGAVLSELAQTAILQATGRGHVDVVRLAVFVAAGLLLAPWRRGEMPVAAKKLTLLGPAYTAANLLFDAQVWAPGAHLLDRPSGLIAFIAVGVAGVGGILCARWATWAAAIAAISLVVGALGVWSLTSQMRLWQPVPWLLEVLCTLVLGIGCAVASALLSSARSAPERRRCAI